MQELETLPKLLMDRGWKPWGIDPEDIELFNLDLKKRSIHIGYMDYSASGGGIYNQKFKSLRELVNLESGLWQFVCKNNLYKKEANNFRENVSKVGNNIGWFNHNYQYRLLESALVPEEELGKFLVENIKTE